MLSLIPCGCLIGIYNISVSDCLDCNKMFEGSCKVHSTDYAYIEDTVVLTKAKASLPSCFYLKQTEATSCYSLGE